MIPLKIKLGGGKRLNGVVTTEEAREKFNEYYDKQKSYLGKVFDMKYVKDKKHTLIPCDEKEFIKCRKRDKNIDGKGDTCLDIAKKVCPKESFGSAKYTATKTGPKRFDIYGVDAFKEGEEFKVTDKNGVEHVYTSAGLPRSKKGSLNKKDAGKKYAQRMKD